MAEARFGAFKHSPRCANLSLANGTGGLDIHDDTKLHIMGATAAYDP